LFLREREREIYRERETYLRHYPLASDKEKEEGGAEKEQTKQQNQVRE